MTDAQFRELIEVINKMNDGIPTWFSLFLGAILSTGSGLLLNYIEEKRRDNKLNKQIELTKNRIDKLLEQLNFESFPIVPSEVILEINDNVRTLIQQLIKLSEQKNGDLTSLDDALFANYMIKVMIIQDIENRKRFLEPETQKEITRVYKVIKEDISI